MFGAIRRDISVGIAELERIHPIDCRSVHSSEAVIGGNLRRYSQLSKGSKEVFLHLGAFKNRGKTSGQQVPAGTQTKLGAVGAANHIK